MLRSMIAFIAMCVMFGCTADVRPSRAPQVVDSAGVTVITHPGRDLDPLTVSPTADLVAGDDPGAELYRVRGGILLPGGRVAIANGGSNQVLVFTGSGDLAKRVGRAGRGPREFSGIMWLQAREAGGFVVYDAVNRRISRFDEEGEFLGGRPIAFPSQPDVSARTMVAPGFAIGVTRNGGVLMIPWAVAALDGVTGPLPVTAVLRRTAPDGGESTVVDSVVVRTWYEAPQPTGPPIDHILEAPALVFSANRRWIAYSEARRHRVTVLEDGVRPYVVVERRPRLVFRPDTLPSGVSHAADSLPAYRALQVDAEGRVWLKSAAEPAEGYAEWRVITDGGMQIQSVVLPASSTVLDASGDRVLLLERDELDVETVALRQVQGLTF